MTGDPQDFEIKYWAGGNDFQPNKQEGGRSIKKKLLIVFSFIITLVVAPIIFLSFSNLDFSRSKKVNVAKAPVLQEKAAENPAPKKEEDNNKIEVINNDSYWKISKRVCGEGKYYLSIRDQNNGKALFEGDSVTANCNIEQ